MDCSMPGLPGGLEMSNSQSLLKLMSIESVMPSNHLILCHPFLLLPSIFPSIRVFSNESVLCIRWPKYWSLSFNISPSNEYSGLISFRMDWLDFLAIQGTLCQKKKKKKKRKKNINPIVPWPASEMGLVNLNWICNINSIEWLHGVSVFRVNLLLLPSFFCEPLEEGMATNSSILAWRISMDRGAWRATVHGVAKSWP